MPFRLVSLSSPSIVSSLILHARLRLRLHLPPFLRATPVSYTWSSMLPRIVLALCWTLAPWYMSPIIWTVVKSRLTSLFPLKVLVDRLQRGSPSACGIHVRIMETCTVCDCHLPRASMNCLCPTRLKNFSPLPFSMKLGTSPILDEIGRG